MGVGATEKPLIKRRFWKMGKAIIFLVRKCMVKRRYLHEEFTKMGKLLANNWRSMILQSGSSGAFAGVREYEFSCSNSPAFSHKLTRPRQRISCFSYTRSTSFEDKEEHKMRVDILQQCDFSAVEESATQTYALGDGEELGTPVSRSIDVRVDREVEDFIARFHSQIKFERQISLLEYEEMLARGA